MSHSIGNARVRKLNTSTEVPEWLRQRLHWADKYRQVVEERNRLRKENLELRAKQAQGKRR